MELQNQQDHDEMPIPLNSTYGHVHPHMMMHHHHHHHPTISHMQQIPLSNGPINIPDEHETASATTRTEPFKKMVVRYKECLKNHAASMGGNATDGCGEFMPSGEEGTLEALVCSACNCHRNFHRKETEGENRGMGRKLMLGYHPMIMPYNAGAAGAAAPSESDEQDGGGGGGVTAERPVVKKRFRTKFSQEQRNKMQSFAEKVGWKIQKQEESLVQQFCQEIGVKRRVLKVWIHNNKHNLAKKNHQSNAENQVLETNN